MAERLPERLSESAYPRHTELEVAAATTIERGKIVALNASGYAVEASASAALKIVGVATHTVANAGANGAKLVVVELGPFKFTNSSTAACTRAHLFDVVYAEDDETISSTDQGGGLSPAGQLLRVDTDGVYVNFGPSLTQAELKALFNFQTGTATLVSGTVTVGTTITLNTNSVVEVHPVGAITGSTNYGSCNEVEASRTVGGPGTGEMVLQARGADGAIDADAAGDVRWTIMG